MSETLASEGGVTAGRAGADPRRWWALAVLSLATLMVVLDATVVNVALPQAQNDLHISVANRQWVVTAYTLPFGGLLLLGGRIADYSGRKRAFLIGLAGFAVASAIGGAATGQSMLFAARALQGTFAALLAPASLSLLNTTFTDRRERATAFGVYGAVLGAGSAVGLLAGGLLTNYLDWRWCLYINIPIAAVAFFGAFPLIRESRATGVTRYDAPGALLITAGLALLVYGFAEAADGGWDSGGTVGSLVAGGVLIIAFVAVQLRTRYPLLPLHVVLNRNRGGAFLSSLLIFLAMMGMFLFQTYYLQGVLGYSALKTGLALLPLTLVVVVGAGVVTALMRVVPPRTIITVSFLVCAVALVWFSRIGADTSYVSHVLGPEIVVGLGMAGILVPATNLALLGVGGEDSGVASGLVSAAQQVGGSIGTALLNTIAAEATANYLSSHPVTDPALGGLTMAEGAVHGYSVGFLWAAAFFAAGALVSLVLVRASSKETAGAGMATT
ncbi:DHA2 family efflux MFS transporter permease subunit [Actinomadura sp. 9N215]|uniref:DHA2 family efflux MFS transporter permease subunit n=1 Tax=Actinomadura sp. 9N215 TaxID=3375150 RepID=UPI003789D4E7